jgi:uroporphyrin-3 C-methyltransferase
MMTDLKLDSSPDSQSTENNSSTAPVTHSTKNTKTVVNKKASISKLAIVALFFALIAVVGNGGMFYWHTEQQKQLKQNVLGESLQQLSFNQSKSQQAFENMFAEQQSVFEQRLANINAAQQQKNQQVLAELQNSVERITEMQPSDWLIHEAEYLIRVAGRTLWLERDTQAASNLLKDAAQRLQELNDPQYLPIRATIYQDIEALALMPALETEEAILTLMALSDQVDSLSLSLAYLPDVIETEEQFTLSDNSDDWQANLSKTWHKFLADFITIRQHDGKVEPLLTPQQQINLQTNLRLKLQQTQWAAVKENNTLYQQHLVAIQQWLNDYYDMDISRNQHFYQSLEALKSKLIYFNYPSNLQSLPAIRDVTKTKPSMPDKTVVEKTDDNVKPIIEDALPLEKPSEKPLEPVPSTNEQTGEALI